MKESDKGLSGFFAAFQARAFLLGIPFPEARRGFIFIPTLSLRRHSYV